MDAQTKQERRQENEATRLQQWQFLISLRPDEAAQKKLIRSIFFFLYDLCQAKERRQLEIEISIVVGDRMVSEMCFLVMAYHSEPEIGLVTFAAYLSCCFPKSPVSTVMMQSVRFSNKYGTYDDAGMKLKAWESMYDDYLSPGTWREPTVCEIFNFWFPACSCSSRVCTVVEERAKWAKRIKLFQEHRRQEREFDSNQRQVILIEQIQAEYATDIQFLHWPQDRDLMTKLQEKRERRLSLETSLQEMTQEQSKEADRMFKQQLAKEWAMVCSEDCC